MITAKKDQSEIAFVLIHLMIYGPDLWKWLEANHKTEPRLNEGNNLEAFFNNVTQGWLIKTMRENPARMAYSTVQTIKAIESESIEVRLSDKRLYVTEFQDPPPSKAEPSEDILKTFMKAGWSLEKCLRESFSDIEARNAGSSVRKTSAIIAMSTDISQVVIPQRDPKNIEMWVIIAERSEFIWVLETIKKKGVEIVVFGLAENSSPALSSANYCTAYYPLKTIISSYLNMQYPAPQKDILPYSEHKEQIGIQKKSVTSSQIKVSESLL